VTVPNPASRVAPHCVGTDDGASPGPPRDGKVVDGTAIYDGITFNDLWTRVAPEP
jgi:hypothetical protein